MSRWICGCGRCRRSVRPAWRRRRESAARSSISDESANDSSERSTTTSWAQVKAREKAVRRRLCVARSSSPRHLRTAGSGSKSTMSENVLQPAEKCVCDAVGMPSVEDVEAALTNVIDPELGLDFVELGLIYGIEVDAGNVHVTFTLTSPGCPIGPQVSEQIEEFVGELEGVDAVESSMVFTPPWTPERMSEDAKFALGF